MTRFMLRVIRNSIFVLLLCSVITAFVQIPLTALAAPGEITTVAGGGGFNDGGPAIYAIVYHPTSVFMDNAGNTYIADQGNHRIRKTDAYGNITTIAGTGIAGYSGDGGFATAARLTSPTGVFADAAGNVYCADYGNNRIRKIDTAGIITTVAGQGDAAFGGDNGPATAASLFNPTGLFVDANGNLYIADYGNNRIRKVETTGIIRTVAGTGLARYSGDGGLATRAGLNHPYGVVVDAAGTVYIADKENHRIRRVTASGTISTFAGNGVARFSGDGVTATATSLSSPAGVALDPAGNLYIADSGNNRIRKVATNRIINTMAGDGTAGYEGDGQSALAAKLNGPYGVYADTSGNIVFGDLNNNRVRSISAANGTIATMAGNGITTFFGDGGPAGEAGLSTPSDVFVALSGDIYIADTYNHSIRKIDSNGVMTTVAGTGVAGYSGDGALATNAALSSPMCVSVDAAGNIFIADYLNNRIRMVNNLGIISTVAGNGVAGYSGDGGPAWIARINGPTSVAVDPAGNLFIADYNNNRLRKVNGMGYITTVAGNGSAGYYGDGIPAAIAVLNHPISLTFDRSGNLYIADYFNHRVRKIDAYGFITTVAGNGTAGYGGDGGPATAAMLNHPRGTAVNADGELYIADLSNNRVRTLDASGILSTLAGNGDADFSGDGGPASSASLNNPTAVFIDTAANMYIADSLNNRIRKVAMPPRPTGTIAINSNSGYSNSPTVTLNLSCTSSAGECVEMLFSDNDVSWTASESYAENKVWTTTNGDGTKTVYVKFKNSSGNWSNAYQDSIILDTTAPAVTITSPAVGIINNTTPLLTYAVSDGAVTVELDNAVVSRVSGNTLDPLADGPHTVRVRATDAAGNSGVGERTFTVDTIAPTVTITSPAPGTTNDNTPLFAYTVTDGTVTVKVDGVTVNKIAGNDLAVLNNGPHTVRVESKDVAGNIGSAEVAVTVEAVFPTVALSSPSAALTNNNMPLLAYAASEGAITVMVDGVIAAKASGDTLDLMSDGTHTVRVDSTDAAGNIGYDEVAFTVDTISPFAANIVQLASGLGHSVILKSDGTVLTWGRNNNGELGDGKAVLLRSEPANVGIQDHWSYVSADVYNTMAIRSDGALFAWGWNEYGQIGDGTTVDKSLPTRIAQESAWSSVIAGGGRTFAIKTNGTLWAWGYNGDGALGDGTTVDKLTPIQIGTDASWTHIGAGSSYTLGTRSDGTLWAWGSNQFGQLGDGTTVDKHMPVQVGTDAAWVAVSAGGGHSIGMKADGSIWSWGNNQDGQLGDGTTTDRHSPVQIGIDKTWTTVIAGSFSSYGLKADGSLWAWGDNIYGEIGDGTNMRRESPVRIGTGTTWIAVAGEDMHGLAVRTDGSLWGWGSNTYGQLSSAAEVRQYAPIQIIGPSGVFINGGANSTNSVSVRVDIYASDANGVAEMQFSNDGLTWDAPEPYSVIKNWTLEPGEGTKTVYAKFKDNAGNWSGVFSDSILLDTSAPAVSISAPAEGLTSTSTPVLSYTVSDGAVDVRVDGMVVNKTSGSALGPLSEGPHLVRVESTDIAGNIGFVEVTFTVDVPPTVSLTSPATGYINNATPLLTYMISNGTVVVRVDGVVVNKATGNILDPLPDGLHTVRVEATDAGGTGSAEVSFTVDTIAPTVVIASPATGTTTDNQPLLTYSVSEGTVSVLVDAAFVNKVSGSRLDALPAGQHTVTVIATDTAWNYGRADVTFTVVASPPPSGNTKNDDFETGNLTYLPWITSGNGSWSVKTTTKHGGMYAAEAPVSIVDNQNAALEVTQTCDAGNITFWYSISSEANFDYLRFSIDGVQKGQWSGTVSWTQASYAVTAGSHTFKWVYSKDGSVSTGSDTAWIDDIAFPIP